MIPHTTYTIYSLVAYSHFDSKRDKIRTYLLDHFDTKKLAEDYVAEMNKSAYTCKYVLASDLGINHGIYSSYALRKWLDENPESIVTGANGTTMMKKHVVVDVQIMNLFVEAKKDDTSTRQDSSATKNGSEVTQTTPAADSKDTSISSPYHHNGFVGCSNIGRYLFTNLKHIFIRYTYVFPKHAAKG